MTRAVGRGRVTTRGAIAAVRRPRQVRRWRLSESGQTCSLKIPSLWRLSACPPVVWLRPLRGSAGAGRGIHALHARGWTISAIARHLGHDRKTIRAYLDGRVAGQRRRSVPDPFGVFVDYCRARLAEDPHLWALSTGRRARLPSALSVVYSWPAQPRVAAALRALPPGGQAARRGDRTSSGAGGPVGLARGQQAHQ